MTMWIFKRTTQPPHDDIREEPIVIAAERFFDACRYAYMVFQTTNIEWELAAAPLRPEVTLRWEGTDAGAVPKRRMIVEISE